MQARHHNNFFLIPGAIAFLVSRFLNNEAKIKGGQLLFSHENHVYQIRFANENISIDQLNLPRQKGTPPRRIND